MRTTCFMLVTVVFAGAGVVASSAAAAPVPEVRPMPAAASTAACAPVPPAVRGTYWRLRPADGRVAPLGFTYWLGGACGTEARWRGSLLGKGTYTLLRGDDRAGEILIVEGTGCPGVGPTAYEYRLEGYQLTLRAVGGRERDGCAPRASDLHDHTFVKGLEGGVRIVLAGARTGRFTLSGAASDSGAFVRTPARAGTRVTLVGAKGTIVLTERRPKRGSRTWTIVRGIGSFVHFTGRGTISGTSRRAVLRGSVSNRL